MFNIVREVFAPMKDWLGVTALLSAVVANKLVTSANMKVGAYTIAAQPAVPARVSVAVTAVGAPDTAGIITVVGKVRGLTKSEVITPVAGSTVWGSEYFESITSITGSGWVIAEGNDTLVVGVGMGTAFNFAGESVTVMCVSGSMWINPDAHAVADATAIKLVAGQNIDLVVKTTLKMITDVSGGTFQYIVWDI